MRDLCIVHLFDVGADVAQTHAQPVKTDDLVLEAVSKNGLALLDQLRLKVAVAILRRVNLDASGGAFKGFTAFAIALVAVLALLLIQVGIHLGLKSRFDELLEHRSKRSIFSKQGVS